MRNSAITNETDKDSAIRKLVHLLDRMHPEIETVRKAYIDLRKRRLLTSEERKEIDQKVEIYVKKMHADIKKLDKATKRQLLNLEIQLSCDCGY